MIRASAWLLSALLLLPQMVAATSGAPISVAVDLPRTTMSVGEPLVINMQVTNTSSNTIGFLMLFSSFFSLTFYQGDVVEGCELAIAVPEPVPPLPPRPPLFGFGWPVTDLQPGETVNCRVTYTQTLYPGRETITLSASIAGTSWPQLAEFTYRLLGAPPTPVPLNSLTWLLLFALTTLLVGLVQLKDTG